MYKNYIFDLYGTLIDINTDEESSELWSKLSLFFSFKGAVYTAEELKSSYNAMVKLKLSKCTNTNYPDFPIEEVFTQLYEGKGISPSEELIEDTSHLFRILSIKYIRLYEGVTNLLKLLKSKDVKIYLLSNAQRIFTLYEMQVLAIDKYFDDILFSSDYKMCKPDSNFFKALINKHNLNVKDSIMIGNDHISDIKGATRCGIDSLYINSNLSPQVKGQLTSTYSIMNMDIDKVTKLLLTAK